MKIDKRKNYYIVLDTEGLGLNDHKKKYMVDKEVMM